MKIKLQIRLKMDEMNCFRMYVRESCRFSGEASFIAQIAVFLVFILLSYSEVHASDQKTKDKMKADLEGIKNIFEVSYAPSEWKQSLYGWDLTAEIEKAKDRVQFSETISIKQFQGIVRDFFNSTRDYHVKVNFYSTESSILPFSVKPCEGRYFISFIDQSEDHPQGFDLSLGDELLELDNKPAADVIEELKAQISSNANPATDEELAAVYLTFRSGRLGHPTPKGRMQIKTRSLVGGGEKTQEIAWKYTSERVSNGFEGAFLEEASQGFSLLGNDRCFDKKLILPEYAVIKTLHQAQDNLDSPEDYIGSKNSLLPPLGTIWRKTARNSPFQAYIFENPHGRLLGFVRISHFELSHEDIDEFASIIDLFEAATEALVIDQMNNPGGYLETMYEILSMLSDRSLRLPQHRAMLTQEEAFEAQRMISLLEGCQEYEDGWLFRSKGYENFSISDDTYQKFLGYYKFIESQWNAGLRFTDLHYLDGVDCIQPHPFIAYTKPILVLVNGLDFSCADFFPAILQDNRRAIVMGSRTAGAGGCALEVSFRNRHGIESFSLTTSIAERPGGLRIENVGVVPDIEYNFSLDDILYGYCEFADRINKQLELRLLKE